MSKKILFGVVAAVVVVVILFGRSKEEAAPTPSPSVTVSVSPRPSVSASVSPSKTPTASPTKTPTPSPTMTPTPTPTQTPTPTPSSTSTPTPSSTPTPGPQTHAISINDFSFNPGTLNVKRGDIVRFTNHESFNHQAVHDGGQWTTPVLSENESHDLDTSDLAAGTYRYHCGIHGQAMVGTLRITD